MYDNSNDNNYTSNAGNYSYTWVTNNVTVDHSFNHTNSHNGHGRGGVGGILASIVGLGLPVAVLWFIVSVLAEVLR